MKDVLVFFSFRKHKTGYYRTLFEPLEKEASRHGLKLLQGSLKDLHTEVINNQLTVTESVTGRRLDSFDAVDFEMWLKAPQQALAAATYLDRNHIPMSTREPLSVLSDTKVSEIATMSGGKIPLPNTFTSSNREILKIFKDKPRFDYPFIVKAADTFGGKMNYLVKNYQELKAALNANPDQAFVLQEFIPNDFDYRVIVLGGKIRLVMKRMRDPKAGAHVNNTSAGAEAEFLPIETLTKNMQDSVLAAARITRRSGFSGVDVIVNKETGQHYILEVNDQPAIQVGASPEVKTPIFMEYLHELAYGEGK